MDHPHRRTTSYCRRAGAALPLLLLMAACGDGNRGDASSERDYVSNGTLTYVVADDPGALDPHLDTLGTSVSVTGMTYDRMATLDEDLELVPNVATKWDVTPTSVTYTVRRDVTCSDGSALTPEVMARNFAFVQDPANASPLLGPTLPVGSTVASDDAASTVTITSPTPYAYLLKGASELELVCEAGLDDRSLLAKGTAGSGPYVLESVKAEDEYVLTAREGYEWGPDGASTDVPGFPAKLVLKVVGDETTTANLLLGGEVNIATVVGSARARLESQDQLSEVVTPRGGAFGLLMHQQPGHPGEDRAVRTALLAATDVEQVREVLLDGRGLPPDDLTVPPSPCQDGAVLEAAPPFDVEAANAQLDQAGWTGKDGAIRSKDGSSLSFKFLYVPSFGGESVSAGMELLASQWKAVGAQVQATPVTAAALNEALFGTGDWDAVLIPFSPDEPGYATAFISGPPPPDGSNVGAISNPEFDASAARAITVLGEEGCELWYEAQRALIEQGDYLPVANQTQAYYGHRAEFVIGGPFGEPLPTSLRLLE